MFLFMRKMIFFAVMMAIATTCSAATENESVNENANNNVVEEVLANIDGTIKIQSLYIDEFRNMFLVEYGQRFIRVRDFKTHELVATLCKSVSESIGDWVDGANTVMYDAYFKRYVPAVGIETDKGFIYKSAKHRQFVPKKRVASLRQEFHTPIKIVLSAN